MFTDNLLESTNHEYTVPTRWDTFLELTISKWLKSKTLPPTRISATKKYTLRHVCHVSRCGRSLAEIINSFIYKISILLAIRNQTRDISSASLVVADKRRWELRIIYSKIVQKPNISLFSQAKSSSVHCASTRAATDQGVYCRKTATLRVDVSLRTIWMFAQSLFLSFNLISGLSFSSFFFGMVNAAKPPQWRNARFSHILHSGVQHAQVVPLVWRHGKGQIHVQHRRLFNQPNVARAGFPFVYPAAARGVVNAYLIYYCGS